MQRAPQSRPDRTTIGTHRAPSNRTRFTIYELATESGVFAGTIRSLESGKPADKRVFPALATALRVPLCRLVCGNHSCPERACVSARLVRAPQQRRC